MSNKESNKLSKLILLLIFINTSGLFIFSVSTGFFGKSIYDARNIWQYSNNCSIVSYNIRDKSHSQCHRNDCTSFVNYYAELSIHYFTNENLPIKTKINLSEKSNYVKSLNQVYSIIGSNPINKTIECYYLKSNPAIVTVEKPLFDYNTHISFLYFCGFGSLTFICLVLCCCGSGLCFFI